MSIGYDYEQDERSVSPVARTVTIEGYLRCNESGRLLFRGEFVSVLDLVLQAEALGVSTPYHHARCVHCEWSELPTTRSRADAGKPRVWHSLLVNPTDLR